MRRALTVLALVDLVQDIDVLLPVLIGLDADPGVTVKIVVSDWLATASPRTAALLKAHGLKSRQAPRPALQAGTAPSLKGVDAVITASESGHAAHAAGHALARRADRLGILTYALQHGLQVDPEERSSAASRYFLGWTDAAPGAGPEQVAVGRPMLAATGAPPVYDVGVFENLHWERYEDDDRSAFVERLLSLARGRPDLSILVRSHPAGGWLDRHADTFARFSRLVFETSAQSRARLTAGPAAVATAARIITTPSTVALDAAMANRPVALAMDGGYAYAPLPVLRTAEAWMEFVDRPALPDDRAQAFARSAVVDGDAVSRILARIRQDLP